MFDRGGGGGYTEIGVISYENLKKGDGLVKILGEVASLGWYWDEKYEVRIFFAKSGLVGGVQWMMIQFCDHTHFCWIIQVLL